MPPFVPRAWRDRRIAQLTLFAVNLEHFAHRRFHANGVNHVRRRKRYALADRLNNLRGIVQRLSADHEVAQCERLNILWPQARNARHLARFRAHLGAEAYERASTVVACATNGQARAADRVSVQNDHLAGINPVRVLDLVAVHAPNFGPAPRLLQEFAGNTPQRVAAHHRVLVGRIGGDLNRGRSLCRSDHRG